MVKQITVIPVNDSIVEPETAPEQVEDIIKLEDDIIREKEEIATVEKEEIATVEKVDETPKQITKINVKKYANYRQSNNTSSMPSLW
jgi:septal ring factor EnvC (AmiA/AmiB activator)